MSGWCGAALAAPSPSGPLQRDQARALVKRFETGGGEEGGRAGEGKEIDDPAAFLRVHGKAFEDRGP